YQRSGHGTVARARWAWLVPYPRLARKVLFFFDGAPPTQIYTLSLHDALPISMLLPELERFGVSSRFTANIGDSHQFYAQANYYKDRKSTRLNSSHVEISYAVFCLKKKTSALQITERTVKFHIGSLFAKLGAEN